MPTPPPTSEPYLPQTGSPDDGDKLVDATAEGFADGFDAGRLAGFFEGKNTLWDFLLICLGEAALADDKGGKKGKHKGKKPKQVQCYLEVMTCLLEMDNLSRDDLEKAKNEARDRISNFDGAKLRGEIEKVIADHFKPGP
jgi:hypothetical protein